MRTFLLLFFIPACVAAQPVDSSATRVPDLSHRTIVFSIDDAYHSIFTNVYPLLRRHGMPMTLGVITDYVGSGQPSYQPSSRFMNRTEIQELIDSCAIEIASHSITHPFLTRLDSARAWHEISRSRQMLESLFGTSVVTFVYPYGDMNPRVRKMVKSAGYKMGRAVLPGDPNFWLDPYRLPCYELRNTTRLDDVRERIARRPVTIILMHQIVRQPSAFTQWGLADFEKLVEWIAATGVRVRTLRQLHREWWFEKFERIMQQVAAAYPDRRKALLFEEVDVDATRAQHPRGLESLDIRP